MGEDRSEENRLLRRRQETLHDLVTNDAIVEGEFDAAVREITEAAVEIIDVARVNVWLFDDDSSSVRCVDHYDSRTGEHDSGKELAVTDHPAYFEALRSHRTLAVADAQDDGRTAELTDGYLAPNGIASLLDATLRAEGEFVGVVCFEHVGEPREWTGDEIQFAGDIADVVHRALRNKRSAEHRKQLEYRQSLLEAQHEAFPNGVLVVGENGEILSHNDRFGDLWDLPSEVLERGSLADVLEALRSRVSDVESFRECVDLLFGDYDSTARGECRLDDGRTIEWYSTAVESESGTQYGRLWTVRDVTDRKNRQAELEQKKRAIDEAPIGIVLCDASRPDNPIIYANDEFAEITGYDESEIIGRNCRFLQGERTEPEPVAELRAAIDDERPVTVELRNYRKDGSKFWNRVTIAPVRDDDGTVVNFVGFQRDVTEYREATRQLKVLHRVLRHNLSNQLTIVRGYAEAVATETTGETAEMAAVIVDEIDNLVDATDKHREIVRLLDEDPSVVTVDLDAALDRVVETVTREHPSAEVTVTGTDAGTVTAIPVIETAIRELATNAVVHSDRETPRVKIDVESDDDRVGVRIADGGPKIPDEEAQILTGDQEVSPLNHGLGMGLWLVYLIVTLSQGDVSLKTNTDDRSVVYIELPRDAR